MSKPASSLADVQSLAARCVEMADHQLDADFEAKFGHTPADFAALPAQAQQAHLQSHSETELRVAQEHPGFGQDDVQAVAGLRSSLLGHADRQVNVEKPTREQFVAEILRRHESGQDHVFEAYRSVYGEPNDDESDLEYVRRCAEQDYADSVYGGCIYQDVIDQWQLTAQDNVSNGQGSLEALQNLGQQQAAMAERAFEAYNFGEGVTVAGASGWEYYAAGHERSREVYVENAIDDGKENSTTRLGFTVRFDPQTGALAEAYALDHKGQIWGSLPQGNVEKEALPCIGGSIQVRVEGKVSDEQSYATLIAKALPATEGYEKGFKDALESMCLALANKLSPKDLNEAITTALDAYANNAEDARDDVTPGM